MTHIPNILLNSDSSYPSPHTSIEHTPILGMPALTLQTLSNYELLHIRTLLAASIADMLPRYQTNNVSDNLIQRINTELANRTNGGL